MTEGTRLFIFVFGIALLLILIALVESQIFLRIYGAGNIPTLPFLVTIAVTCFIYRKFLGRAFDWYDRRLNRG